MSQNEKIINTIRNSKPPIQDEIEEWQSFETNEQMHVKYEPNSTSSKNHLDAILADVNEDSKNVEEFLNRNLISDLIGNEFKVDYQENILSELGDITISSEDNLGSSQKREFVKEEKRRREDKKNQNILSHKNKNQTHKH